MTVPPPTVSVSPWKWVVHCARHCGHLGVFDTQGEAMGEALAHVRCNVDLPANRADKDGA